MALQRDVHRGEGGSLAVQSWYQISSWGYSCAPLDVWCWLLDNNEGLQCMLGRASVCNLYSYWDRGGVTWDSKSMGSSETC